MHPTGCVSGAGCADSSRADYLQATPPLPQPVVYLRNRAVIISVFVLCSQNDWRCSPGSEKRSSSGMHC